MTDQDLRKTHVNYSGFVSIAMILVILLALVACSPSPPMSVASGRPDCVDRGSYSGVILQVMGIEPEWESIGPIKQGSLSQWVIQDDRGVHTLSVAMTRQGCVCATEAASRFRGAYSQGEMAGLMQGAAVAPISELEYTSGWLEPRILLRCPIPLLLRSEYVSEGEMEDGTIWRLSCSGGGELGEVELSMMFSVLTPECVGVFD